MTILLAPLPIQSFRDNNGNPLAGGLLYTYQAGTSTLQSTYTDASGTTPNANPVVLNSRGEASVWLTSAQAFKLVLQDSYGVLIWSVDQVASGASSGANSDIVSLSGLTTALSIAQGGTGATTATAAAVALGVTASADLAASGGAGLVGYLPAGVGGVAVTVAAQLNKIQASSIDVTRSPFYAKCDWNGVSGTDDTAAIQAAADACPIGGAILIPGHSKISAAIRIYKPMTIRGNGPGSFANDSGFCGVIQTTASANAFTLVATTANYSYGQYGIVDVHFADMAITGPSSNNMAQNGIGVDTSVNAGDFHIRECTLNNVNIKYFNYGRRLIGIAYLNDVYGGCTSQCGIGDCFEKGASSDVGGQNRYFGWTAVLNVTKCASLFEDTVGGNVGFHGCTLSESQYGISCNQELKLYTSPDCEFETNSIAGVYISIKNNTNPASSAPKTVGGKFLNNAADIWVDKQSTGFAGGGFYWPMKIDDVYFGSAVGLKITVPSGHVGIDSPAFVIGMNVGGLLASQVNPTQISSNFQGTWDKQRRVTKRISFNGSYVSGATLAVLPTEMVVVSTRIYLTANASSYSNFLLGDPANNSRYISSLNAQTQALNTWVNGAVLLPDAALTASNNRPALIGTGGILGAAGVIEIDGYIP